MRRFLRRASPKRAINDFASYWQQPTPYRWHILGVSMAATFAIFMTFIPENQRIAIPPPQVVFISTFDEDRSEAEIIASNCANQVLKDELQAKLDEQAEFTKDAYRTLGRATFVDVEEMERKIEEERAAKAAAAPQIAEPSPEELAQSVEEYCARAQA